MVNILTESEHVELMVQLIRIPQKCWQYTFINSLLMTLWFIQVVFALILYKCSPIPKSINTLDLATSLTSKHKETVKRNWCISLMESTCKKCWVWVYWPSYSLAFLVILKRSIWDRNYVTWEYLCPIPDPLSEYFSSNSAIFYKFYDKKKNENWKFGCSSWLQRLMQFWVSEGKFHIASIWSQFFRGRL